MNETNPAKQNETPDNQVTGLTSDRLIQRLQRALSRDGDFPASAKVVNQLKQLTNDPDTTANQLTEIILQEPSLGTRVLSLVNSAFYQRSKPIMTISQAVVQIGMKPLADLCAGLVLLQKFIPAARRDSAFAGCLRHMMITSLLSGSINSEIGKAAGSSKSEAGYLAGSLAEMGTLLLAYYFPRIFESAVRRSQVKKQDIAQSIKDLTGLAPLQLSIEVVNALNLPAFYREVIVATYELSGGVQLGKGPSQVMPMELAEIQRLSKGLYAARAASDILANNSDSKLLEAALVKVKEKVSLDPKIISIAIGQLPAAFAQQCSAIELQLPALPEYVATFSTDAKIGEATQESAPLEKTSDKGQFGQFIEEIRQAVENGDPTASIVTTVMETLAWGLKFDRVILLLLNPAKTQLMGRMLLGNAGNIDPKSIVRVIADAPVAAPEIKALKEARPIFHGEALFDGGWPLAAMPIGFGARGVGVVYADRIAGGNSELGAREQAAITMLTELLNQSIQGGK